MNRWFLSQQGKLKGPYTLPQLQEMVKTGTLKPTDLICPEGGAPVLANRVPGLFTEPAPAKPVPAKPAPAKSVPAKPVPVKPAPVAAKKAEPPPVLIAAKAIPAAPVKPAKQPAQRPAAKPAAPWTLSKPLLFALSGALGGFIAALVVGQLAWFFFSPPEITNQPGIRIAASESIDAYVGSKQQFNVKVARDNWNGPVTLEIKDAPAGVSALLTPVPAGEPEIQVEVNVDRTAAEGRHPLKIVAVGPADAKVRPAEGKLELNVLPAPPGLGLTVSPKVVMNQAGKRRFTVRISRTKYTGPVNVQFAGVPDGVSLPSVVIPAENEEIEIEASALPDAEVGSHRIAAEASCQNQGSPLSAKGGLILEIRPQPKVDVVFVLDLTNSMQDSIDGIKNGIGDFGEKLERQNIDVRVGLVGYRDIEDQYFLAAQYPKYGYPHGEPFALRFADGKTFTKDYQSFREKLGQQKAESGAERTKDESSLQALQYASLMPYRRDATRVIILVTDAGPRIHKKGDRFFLADFNIEREPYSIAETVPHLKKAKIAQLHMVVTQEDYDGSSFTNSKGKWGSRENPYKRFHDDFKGKYYSIDDIAKEKSFDKILPELSQQIGSEAAPPPPPVEAPPRIVPTDVGQLAPAPPAKGLPAVSSTRSYAEEDKYRLLFAIALWTTIMAAGISLFITLGQQFYLRKGWLQILDWTKALAGGILAGLIGGAIGQIFVQSTAGGAPWEIVSRILGWGMLGSLIGVGMALVIPNLKWPRGLAGGLIGGILGAIAFLIISFSTRGLLGSFGEAFGRLAGAAVLGFCIGLMVALAELAFRQRWLEITFGASEVRTVTLGNSAVTIGSDDKLASVVVSDAAPIALRYRVENDRVLCEDVTTGVTREIQPGEPQKLGAVTIAVCTASTARKSGYTLQLADGKSIALAVGMPLTAADLPGLQPQGTDGMVALVNAKPNAPKTLLLRNRSKQTWKVTDANSAVSHIEPGRGVELADPLKIDFGPLQGTIVQD